MRKHRSQEASSVKKKGQKKWEKKDSYKEDRKMTDRTTENNAGWLCTQQPSIH